MRCMHCNGEMERSMAPFHVDRHGYHLLLSTVPAWVCTQCGEAYFEESEVNMIQGVIEAVDDRARDLVPRA